MGTVWVPSACAGKDFVVSIETFLVIIPGEIKTLIEFDHLETDYRSNTTKTFVISEFVWGGDINRNQTRTQIDVAATSYTVTIMVYVGIEFLAQMSKLFVVPLYFVEKLSFLLSKICRFYYSNWKL